VSLC